MDTRHLTDQELCTLAVPAEGAPEALPLHLSECPVCARSLAEWKSALATVASESGSLEARTEVEWDSAARATMERIRRSGSVRVFPGGRALASRSTRWGLGAAAAVLLAVLLLPARPAPVTAPSPVEPDRTAELSSQDQADDALLRDVARMSRADDDFGDLGGIAPEPRSSAGRDGRL